MKTRFKTIQVKESRMKLKTSIALIGTTFLFAGLLTLSAKPVGGSASGGAGVSAATGASGGTVNVNGGAVTPKPPTLNPERGPLAAPPNPPTQNMPPSSDTTTGTTGTTTTPNQNQNNSANTSTGANANTSTTVASGTTPAFAPNGTGTTPTITGTVSGTSGKQYYIGSDGFLYFLGTDNLLHQFGRFLPKVTITNGVSTAVPNVNGTASAGVANNNNTVAQSHTSAEQQRLVASGQTASPATSQNPNQLTTTNGVGAQTGTVIVPSNTSTNGQLTPTGRVQSNIAITGQVMGNDGRTFFIGADGFLYYQGQDGQLHIFGSGAP